MADDEDDYLSDKFLLEASTPAQPRSYHETRKEALKRAQLKNEQNRHKSRRQLELESREAGLSKSLFERASEEQASGSGAGNKALAMMMKMGFKPGQALGKTDSDDAPVVPKADTPEPQADDTEAKAENVGSPSGAQNSRETSVERGQKHLVQPLPLNEWAGRKGIGLGGKRAASPSQLDRLAKLAKVEEDTGKESFRDRARREFEQRRAEGRLSPAQRTCVNLDEGAGKTFNVLWLNPNNPDSFPEGLLDALADAAASSGAVLRGSDISHVARLRAQMRADALQSLTSDFDDPDATEKATLMPIAPISEELVEEAAQFLRLDPQERLNQVMQYLRSQYFYCFWCGAQYASRDEMAGHCPGPDEDMHD